jgi:hypothetical protein
LNGLIAGIISGAFGMAYVVYEKRPAKLVVTAALCLGLAPGVPASFAATAEPVGAEYAIRWNARDGGPQSGNAALALLQARARRTSSFSIDYYDLPPAAVAPPGFATILRRRVADSGDAELTWKLRADHALADWTCPLLDAVQTKAEVDVTFGGAGAVTRVYSYSCTSGHPDLAASRLSARLKACSASVKRWNAGSLKVEEWRLPGDVLMLEVSGSGANSPAAAEQFRKRVVAPLLAAGIVPSVNSKTELGSRCQ